MRRKRNERVGGPLMGKQSTILEKQRTKEINNEGKKEQFMKIKEI